MEAKGLSYRILKSYDMKTGDGPIMTSDGNIRRFWYKGGLIREVHGIPTVEDCNAIDHDIEKLRGEYGQTDNG